ncbi:MAG: MerR family transcriptional regulator [Patulibacter minatonensis]
MFPRERASSAPHATDAAVDGGATVSAQEMARVTGVGRERLRTWERRHGFPLPVRTPNGTRRYRAVDVRPVVAAARAIEAGVAVADAIAQARVQVFDDALPTGEPLGAAALEHCATPAIAVIGPSPLRVAWANRPTVATPHAPNVGDELLQAVPHFGATAAAELQRLMVDGSTGTVVLEHGDWLSTAPTARRSIAWRLPPEAAEQPTVVVLQVPASAVADEAKAAASAERTDGADRWARAVAGARQALQEERGLGSVQRALGAVARGTGGLDAFLATAAGSRLRTATSVTGQLSPRTLGIDPAGDLAAALDAGEPTWLSGRAARELGVPPRRLALLVPLAAGGQRLGAAFVLYPAPADLSAPTRELLHGLGVMLALTLQREHRGAAAPSPATVG